MNILVTGGTGFLGNARIGKLLSNDNLKEIAEQWIDATKLKKLGWSPSFSLDEGLDRTIAFYTGLPR